MACPAGGPGPACQARRCLGPACPARRSSGSQTRKPAKKENPRDVRLRRGHPPPTKEQRKTPPQTLGQGARGQEEKKPEVPKTECVPDCSPDTSYAYA